MYSHEFEGCYSYNPKADPLKGLTKSEINDFCFAYMKMWYNVEEFTDFNVMYDAGDNDMAADWLVSAGAIDSDTCYPSCKAIERVIEGWAKAYRKLSDRARNKRLDEVFKDCTVVRCEECNHCMFLNDGNEKLYEADLKACWECESTNVVIRLFGEE